MLVFSLISLSAESNADWTLEATSGLLDLYVDFKDIVLDEEFVKSKRMTNYHKEQKSEMGMIYWSSISIVTYDCVKRLQQVERFRYTGQMGSGTRLENDFFKSDWEKVAAGTFNDNYMVRVCSGGDGLSVSSDMAARLALHQVAAIHWNGSPRDEVGSSTC